MRLIDREKTDRRRRGHPLAGLALAGLALAAIPAAPGALAQAAPEPPRIAHASPQHRDENGEMLKRKAAAITLAFTYNSDANADVSGGGDTGGAYLQRIGAIADADLDRLLGWHGASAHLSIHAIQGTGLSGRRVGNILTVSGIEAEPALRLFNLWIEQKLGSRLTVRAGQFTAGQEFAISPTANLFVNSTFGWPGSFATDLPSGGPAYPLSAPGVRVALQADARTIIRIALFAGDPAGRGGGDPQRRDLHGFNGFRFQGSPFVIGEIGRSAGGDDPAWSVALGGWVHFDRFDDLRYDIAGGSFAAPLSSGQPARHAGNHAAYAIADGRLWRSGARSLHGFIRLSASPADRNPIDLYLDGGLALAAPFAGRPNDSLGLGVAIARTSPRRRALIRDQAALTGIPAHPADAEAVIEASYQLKLASAIYVQPNLQWIVHPSGALLGDLADYRDPPGHALVVGLRTSVRL